MKSPIKWSGSKLQLVNTLQKLAPKKFGTYFEPFVGSGALLLNLLPKRAIINDINPFISKMYKVIRDNPDALIMQLTEHQKNNSKDYYLDIRMADRDGRLEKMSDIEQVSRFMYMNKVSFNGLWRVNSKGQNNVPYGKYKNPDITAKERIEELHAYLSSNHIENLNTDFATSLESVQKNDFVYFDPPYIPLNPTSSFTSYSKDGFGYEEQKRLRDLFFVLNSKGVFVMLSNSSSPLVRELYDRSLPNVKFHEVETKRMISAKSSSRGSVKELIITNY
jgi:DNA adenine methylase